MGHVGMGWGGSWRVGVGHVGVRCGGMGHTGWGWVGHAEAVIIFTE